MVKHITDISISGVKISTGPITQGDLELVGASRFENLLAQTETQNKDKVQQG